MKVAVGGTFDRFHLGHQELLRRAFEVGDLVVIGICTDSFVRRKGREVEPYEERRERVRKWIEENFEKEYEIVPLEDRYGPTISDPSIEGIVVSPETYKVAKEINEIRKERGIRPLRIYEIPLILAKDFMPICSSRIREGEIDELGNRLRPVVVGIGTENPSKYLAVKDYFLKELECELEFKTFKVDVGKEQPFEEETYEGALRRAKEALRRSKGDYGVGIESGIFKFSLERSQVFLVGQVACVLDKRGIATFGTSSSFQLSRRIFEEILEKGSLGAFAKEITGEEEINKREGFVGYLSRGEVIRYDLSYEAIRNAFMPRKRLELYYRDRENRESNVTVEALSPKV